MLATTCATCLGLFLGLPLWAQYAVVLTSVGVFGYLVFAVARGGGDR